MSKKNKTLPIEVDITGMSAAQIRLVRRISALISQVGTTESEETFFESSAELMRTCASLVQQSQFINDKNQISEIPYAQQALEYSMDLLQEHMSSARVVTYDN